MAPVIPTYQSRQVPQGTVAGRISPQINEPSTTASKQLNTQAISNVLRLQQERNVVEAREAVNGLRSVARSKMAELQSRQGAAANGIKKEYEDFYNEEVGRVNESLGSYDTQTLFKDTTDRMRESDLDSLSVHEAREFQRHKEDVLQETLFSAEAEAAVDPFNENKLRGLIEGVNESIDFVRPGANNKATQDRAKASLLTSALTTQIIKDAPTARANIEKWKADLGGAYPALLDKVKAEGVRQQAQQITDVISATEGDYKKQLEIARTIKHPELRDAVVGRLDARQNEAETLNAIQKREFADALTQDIIDAPSLLNAYDIADKAEGTSRLALRKVADSIFKGVETTDAAMLAQARLRIDAGQIASLQELMREYKPSLTLADWKGVEEYYRKGGTAGGLTDATARTMFKTLTQKDVTNDASASKMYNETWNYMLDELKRSPGTNPTNEWIRSTMARVLQEGEEITGGFIDPDQRYIEAIREGKDSLWLPDLEDSEKDRIDVELKAIKSHVSNLTRRIHKRVNIMELPYTIELKALYDKEVEEKTKKSQSTLR